MENEKLPIINSALIDKFNNVEPIGYLTYGDYKNLIVGWVRILDSNTMNIKVNLKNHLESCHERH